MMTFTKIFIVLSALLTVSTFGAPGHDPPRLDKPTVSPEVTNLDEYLVLQLRAFNYNITPWSSHPCYADKINQYCKEVFEKENYSVRDVEVFNVTYEDCHEPWIMCRHRSATLSIDTTASYIARIPVLVRGWNRHFAIFPTQRGAGSAVTNYHDDVSIYGQPHLHDIIAASAKSIDLYGFEPDIGYYHQRQSWLDAYEKDSAVLNSISQLNQFENLAQMMVISIYDAQKPDLIKGTIPDWHRIYNQYKQVQMDVLDDAFRVKPDSKCSLRFYPSEVIPKD